MPSNPRYVVQKWDEYFYIIDRLWGSTWNLAPYKNYWKAWAKCCKLNQKKEED